MGKLLLRAVRAGHQPKVSQSHVARKAGMGAFRYWQVENGEGLPPSEDEQAAIAVALGVKPSDIAWPAMYAKAV